MSYRRLPHLLVVLYALFTASCGSNPTSAPVETATGIGTSGARAPAAAPARAPSRVRATADGEIYDGPPALAIAPVVDGRAAASPEVSRWWIQKIMAEDLDRTDMFAGVIALEHASEAHEGGVLVQPALTGLTWTRPDQRSGTIAMRIRASDTVTGRVRLDRVYTASCSNCRVSPGQPAVAGPLGVLMQDVAKDLR
ncbi:hypothetical protein [Thiocapsa marina]|uniref:Lipoprotein n=1 Tax=Thiocapsa marina 5811 TaxID=768671 RepID=F9UGA0_9GAMM|nr:hypothetical protein [Thiocapsa marina]EGV16826.1 hypothetical protein ThimaDRAFT_3953 [Thiocapsa marina 5811]